MLLFIPISDNQECLGFKHLLIWENYIYIKKKKICFSVSLKHMKKDKIETEKKGEFF